MTTRTATEISWTIPDGREAVVTVALIGSGTRPRVAVTGATVGGQSVGTEYMALRQPQGDMVARVGRLGLTQTRVDEIETAIAQLKQHPEYTARQERTRQQLAEAEEYERETARIYRAMGA